MLLIHMQQQQQLVANTRDGALPNKQRGQGALDHMGCGGGPRTPIVTGLHGNSFIKKKKSKKFMGPAKKKYDIMNLQ